MSRSAAGGARLVARVRGALPKPIKKPLGYAWRQSAGALTYVRGRNVVRRYTAHYRRARRLFERDGNPSEPTARSLRDFDVACILPGAQASLLVLPDAYPAMVARLARAVNTAFERSADCRLVLSAPDLTASERTKEGGTVTPDEIIAIQLMAPFDIDGLTELSVPIMKELERKVFGSYAFVDKVYIYRSPVSQAAPRASWVWHYDNHPREVLKVMIYLTDVTERTAPFEYIRRSSSSRPVFGSPIAPFYGQSHIDDRQVWRWLSRGYQRHSVTGPTGTMIVFDNNVVHRANLAHDAHRDVVVFQVRPAIFRAEPYISERWTGSFQHFDIHRDPRDVAPRVKG